MILMDARQHGCILQCMVLLHTEGAVDTRQHAAVPLQALLQMLLRRKHATCMDCQPHNVLHGLPGSLTIVRQIVAGERGHTGTPRRCYPPRTVQCTA